MAHRPLALKYRPQVFADLVGQEHVTAVLTRAVETGRIAHAYLFTGARGVGKTTTARILAKALNCERRGSGKNPGAEPCNECTPCLEITSGVSLDVVEIDGASNRGIADVQALREKVRFAPTGGRYRVVILDEVHQLSNDAFAALLKTLEEPPAHVVFIFATTDPQKLPDTIRSRCQRFDFARVPLRRVAERLQEIRAREAKDPEGVKFTLSEGAALLIAHKSEGSMRDAVSGLDQVVSAGEPDVNDELVRRVLGLADREAFFSLAQAIVDHDPAAALRAVHDAFAKGLDPRDVAEGLSEHIRHLLILRVDPEAADLIAVAPDELARLRAQGEGWAEHDLLRLLRLITDVSWPMRDSPQPLVHLEAAVLQMASLESGERLAELLKRLEALEQRLGGQPGAAPVRGGGAAGRVAESSPPARMPASGSAIKRQGSEPANLADTRVSAAMPPRAPATTYSVTPATAKAPTVPATAAAAPGSASTAAAPGMAPTARAMSSTAVAPGRASTAVVPPMASTATAPVMPASAPAASAAATLDAPAGSLDADTVAKWDAAVSGVNAKKRMLGAFLQACRLSAVTEMQVVLAMDDLHRAVVDEKENRAIIATEVARVFGRPMQIQCVPLGGAPPAVPSDQDLAPMIDRTIEWFAGEVIEPGARPTERTRG